MRYIVEEKSGNTYSAMEMCEPSTWEFDSFDEAKEFYDANSSDEAMQKKYLETSKYVSPFKKDKVEYISLHSFDGESWFYHDSKFWEYEDALAFEQEHESC